MFGSQCLVLEMLWVWWIIIDIIIKLIFIVNGTIAWTISDYSSFRERWTSIDNINSSKICECVCVYDVDLPRNWSIHLIKICVVAQLKLPYNAYFPLAGFVYFVRSPLKMIDIGTDASIEIPRILHIAKTKRMPCKWFHSWFLELTYLCRIFYGTHMFSTVCICSMC